MLLMNKERGMGARQDFGGLFLAQILLQVRPYCHKGGLIRRHKSQGCVHHSYSGLHGGHS